MNTLLLDTPDLTLGFFQYVVFSTGEKKYLQVRLEESTGKGSEEKSLLKDELQKYGLQIQATGYTKFHMQTEDSDPLVVETVVF